ncbi:hypothetical protein TNCV_2763791 [Trichonephila clavipes]|nr:hypothetical protein TNCV_2763791 [Trichonephila clavipes]
MEAMDCGPRAIAQQIQSVMHCTLSTRIIRRRLQPSGMSPRRPLGFFTLDWKPHAFASPMVHTSQETLILID